MKKLKLGKMTGQEIADWMSVSYKTYRNSPTKYVSRLKDYCVYEQVRGGAIIKEIFIDEYNPKLKAQQDKIYLEALSKADNNIITVSGAEKTTELSAYQATGSRDRLFGKEPINIEPGAHGLIGFRERIWAIKLGENKYREFTEAEEELFNALIKKDYIGNMTPEVIKARELILKCCVDENKSAAEYQQILTNNSYNFFFDVIEKFRKITGYQISSPTRHTIATSWSWECAKEEQKYKDYLYKVIADLQKNRNDAED